MELEKITLKCTPRCPYNCIFCSSRKEYYNNINTSNSLTLQDWDRIVKEALDLGVKKIYISGGEPTICPYLLDLLKKIRAYSRDVYININTNGFALRNLLDGFISLKINKITLSLTALDRMEEKRMRNAENCIFGVDIIQEIAPFFVGSSTVLNVRVMLNNYNYLNIPEVVDFLKQHRMPTLSLYHPEDDQEKQELLLTKEISEFKSKVIPKLFNQLVLRTMGFRNKLANYAKLSRFCEFFHADKRRVCEQPKYYLSIEPDGMVLPCSVLVYKRGLILGNVRDKSLKQIIASEARQEFIKYGHTTCKTALCPMDSQI